MPSIIFSVFYFLLFYEYKGMGNAIYSIINGCGHLWYLPMLFWCFVGGWLLGQVKIKDGWKIAFLVLLNLFVVISLPLRLSSTISYMVYFYGGFMFYKYSDRINTFMNCRNLVIAWLVFVLLFAVLRPLRDVLIADASAARLQKIIFVVGNHACQLLYAWAGLIAFYGTAVYYTQKHKLSKMTENIAACCFGIYLFQQFVLQLLYYKTSFPTLVGPYWLPWCGFVIAVVVSFVFSSLLLKTKTGRFLIG